MGRGLGVGVALGVALGVGVADGVALGVIVGVAVGVAVAVGVEVGVDVGVAVAVGVGVGVGPDCAQYRRPVLKAVGPLFPPQTIISLPVHTAVCSARAEGALVILVAIQLFAAGRYSPPVFKKIRLFGMSKYPPQTIMSLPVQTAVWLSRPSGALVVVVAVQLSESGS